MGVLVSVALLIGFLGYFNRDTDETISGGNKATGVNQTSSTPTDAVDTEPENTSPKTTNGAGDDIEVAVSGPEPIAEISEETPQENEIHLMGRVVDSKGQPMDWVEIKMERMDAAGETVTETMTTDSDGRYAFEGTALAEYTVSAAKHGYVPIKKIVAGQTLPTNIDFVLGSDTVIDILVTLDGYAMASDVQLVDTRPYEGERFPYYRASTDDDGRLAIRGWPAGATMVSIFSKEGPSKFMTDRFLSLPKGETTELVFEFTTPSASIEGYLMASETDAMIGSILLEFESSAGRDNQSTVTDGTGFYRFGPLPPGTFKMMATERGTKITKVVSGELEMNEEIRVDISFYDDCQVICTVENIPSETRLSGVLLPPGVEIPPDVNRDELVEFFVNWVERAHSNDGVATFTNVEPGKYTLVLAAMHTIEPGEYTLEGLVVEPITVGDESEIRLDYSF